VAVLTITPADPADPLLVVCDLVDLTTAAPTAVSYRQQTPPGNAADQPVDPADVANGFYQLPVTLVGELTDTYRVAALIFDQSGLTEAAYTLYSVGPGWPTDADLANRLGLADTDDPVRVAAANAAAISDAVAVAGIDVAAGPADDGQAEAVLMLGQWWFENRNRPEGLDSLNPVASPYYRRVALGILARGAIPVA
jgi:hypothetical protein